MKPPKPEKRLTGWKEKLAADRILGSGPINRLAVVLRA